MKILIPFCDLRFFETGLAAIKSISKRVKEVHVVHINGEPKEIWKKYATFHKIDVPYASIRSKMVGFFLSQRSIYDQIKEIDVDIVYALSGLWRQELSRNYSSRKHTPYVVYLRGSHRTVRKVTKTNRLTMKIANYLDTRSLKQASRVIPISIAIKKNLEKWGINKEKIAFPVPIGVDTKVFRPMKVERKFFTVAYAGRISHEKRVVHLLKIAEKLKDIHFNIAGKKQMPVSFPDNVEYYGSLSPAEMPEFYNKADLIVLPSITEGIPAVILEAYACGKPVLIATDVVQEELKIFGSSSDIDRLESEIIKLKNSDLEALSYGARSYVQKQFTWDKFGDSMVENFKSVLG